MKVQVPIFMNAARAAASCPGSAAQAISSRSNDRDVTDRNTHEARVGPARWLSGWPPVIVAVVALAEVAVAEIVAAKFHQLLIDRPVHSCRAATKTRAPHVKGSQTSQFSLRGTVFRAILLAIADRNQGLTCIHSVLRKVRKRKMLRWRRGGGPDAERLAPNGRVRCNGDVAAYPTARSQTWPSRDGST